MPELASKPIIVLTSPDGETMMVGVNHNAKFTVPAKLAAIILATGNKNGFWYEGGGGDKAKIAEKLGPISWSGSWDRLIKSESSDFYYALFSNSKAGTEALINRVSDPTATILTALDKAGDRIVHEALHKKTSPTKLIEFLRGCGGGLLAMAEKMPAKKPEMLAFIRRGEELMWPDNWRDSPNSASRIANQANRIRLDAIINRRGVFFLGSDHIPTLRLMSRSLRPVKLDG